MTLGIVQDLWLNWKSPAPFAVKYPEWFLTRWKLDVRQPVDWSAEDSNVWSYVQNCLGVRGLVAVIAHTATPREIMAALDNSKVPLPEASIRWTWVMPEMLGLGTDEFLAEASQHIQVMLDRRLAQLCDFWSEEYVLTTLPVGDLQAMEQLGRQADFLTHKGLRVLGNN